VILDNLYCEFKKQFDSEVLVRILYKASKDRFEEFYPDEPFFYSEFNKACARYDLDLRFDDIEEGAITSRTF
jgi:5-bromo-4-chloroindolyl phosphate hydrolysis protein